MLSEPQIAQMVYDGLRRGLPGIRGCRFAKRRGGLLVGMLPHWSGVWPPVPVGHPLRSRCARPRPFRFAKRRILPLTPRDSSP